MNVLHSVQWSCINWESWGWCSFYSYIYTHILYITHGKPTKEHQHKNTFKAVMVFILKTNGWINIHFRFCLELIMFSFVFFFLLYVYWNNNTVRYVKFLSWLGLMGRFMRKISDTTIWHEMLCLCMQSQKWYFIIIKESCKMLKVCECSIKCSWLENDFMENKRL